MLSLPLHVISPSIQVSNQELAHQQIAWLDYYDYRVVKNTNDSRLPQQAFDILLSCDQPTPGSWFSWYTCVCSFCLQYNEQVEMKNKLHCKSLPSWSPHHKGSQDSSCQRKNNNNTVIEPFQTVSINRRSCGCEQPVLDWDRLSDSIPVEVSMMTWSHQFHNAVELLLGLF